MSATLYSTPQNVSFTKKDWALFREKVDDWQEAYMDKLNKEYIDLETGKKYIKNKENEFVAIDSDGR